MYGGFVLLADFLLKRVRGWTSGQSPPPPYKTLLGTVGPPHLGTELPNLFYLVARVMSFLKWTSVTQGS